MKIKHGYVNLEDLTMRIQFDINSICKLVKLPSFNYSYKERESLGNGWYGSNKETIHAVQKNAYLVVKDDFPIGYIVTETNGKVLLQGKNSNKYIKKYIETNYKPKTGNNEKRI